MSAVVPDHAADPTVTLSKQPLSPATEQAVAITSLPVRALGAQSVEVFIYGRRGELLGRGVSIVETPK